jgi:small subunit ribosomal protein S2
VLPRRQAQPETREIAIMALPAFSMRQLLEAGVHFGHHTRRWNPKMSPFIYGSRNNVHIIDLTQTQPLLARALQALRDVAANGGRILFVATKRQAAELVARTKEKCGMFYVNQRWLGGMLTNWTTIQKSIQRLKELDERLANDQVVASLTKKEMLDLTRQRDKLERALGGIKDMAGLPNLVVVIDTVKESIAVQEAKKLGIPVVAILDTNSDPEGIAYPVPGNDDALRAIELYLELFWGAVLDGVAAEAAAAGIDIGAADAPPPEAAEAGAEAAAAP